MTSWLLTTMAWWQWLTLGAPPWWLWVLVAIWAAVAFYFLAPLPIKVRQLGSWAILTCLLLVAAESKGYHEGTAYERAKWERQVAAEVTRLNNSFIEAIALERKIADAAVEAMVAANKEREDAIEAARKDPNAGAVVIPEHLARSLCDIAGGCQGSTPRDPPRPRTLRNLFQRAGPPANP